MLRATWQQYIRARPGSAPAIGLVYPNCCRDGAAPRTVRLGRRPADQGMAEFLPPAGSEE